MDKSVMEYFDIKEYDKSMPISRKAYYNFLDRLYSVMGHSIAFECTLGAFECYLKGISLNRSEYSSPACFFAFEILRIDIDKAIQRSAAARRRASLRKQVKEAAASDNNDESLQKEDAGKPLAQQSGIQCHAHMNSEPYINQSVNDWYTTSQTLSDEVDVSALPAAPPLSVVGV